VGERKEGRIWKKGMAGWGRGRGDSNSGADLETASGELKRSLLLMQGLFRALFNPKTKALFSSHLKTKKILKFFVTSNFTAHT